MSNEKYELIPLPWDTDYFGVSSARVNLHASVGEAGQAEILNFCKDYEFVTISNIGNISENNHWIGNKTNAFLADVNIQFIKDLAEEAGYKDDKSFVETSLSRNEQILDIAKNSFHYSRFFNDPKLPEEQARNLYLHWTECAFGQEDKYFAISEKDEKIAGFILFHVEEGSCVIELIAVDEKYQGQGVGKSLIRSMEAFAIAIGIEETKVGTQVNNISAANFYSAMGFKCASCGSMYHLWRKK